MNEDAPQTGSKKLRVYDAINVKFSTKERFDELYYKLKVKNKYRSYDDFVKQILDFFEDGLQK